MNDWALAVGQLMSASAILVTGVMDRFDWSILPAGYNNERFDMVPDLIDKFKGNHKKEDRGSPDVTEGGRPER
ncbi:MAG: hypothetical protein ACLR23_02555 [Clostridia bacterium]